MGPTDQPGTDETTQPRTPRAGSKLAIMVELLARTEGATVAEMAAATRWQAHSVRTVLSGTLTRKFGLMIESEKVDGRGRVYRFGSARLPFRTVIGIMAGGSSSGVDGQVSLGSSSRRPATSRSPERR